MLSVAIRKQFHSMGSAPFVLDVSAEFPAGVTAVFGESGAGKSTLLDCIAGLQRPDAGIIKLGEATLFDGQRGIALRPAERKVGYVFQSLALFPHLTVEENVAYGLFSLPKADETQRVEKTLRAFRVQELRQRKPAQISGGEKQRVALARSLVTQPRALLLDEPLTGLDAGLKSAIMSDLRKWNETNRIPILYVTHSQEEVRTMGDRIVVLEAGHVVQTGRPDAVLSAPATRSITEAIGFENIFEATVVERRREDGVMRVAMRNTTLTLEVPLPEGETMRRVGVAIRAGDILVATQEPRGLSARNVLAGKIVAQQPRGDLVELKIDVGVLIAAHVTPGAVRALGLAIEKPVWVIIKTHSCHLIRL